MKRKINKEESKEEDDGISTAQKLVVTPEAKEEIESTLDPEGAQSLLEFIRKLNEGLCDRKEQLALPAITDKAKRKAVHGIFKTHLPEFQTHTKEIDGEKKIIVFLGSEMSNNK
jgi:mRNA-degrading endonuclease RelE of RelBE toxin-antitoxin system